MLRLRKGIRLETLRLPVKKALISAAQLGAEGVEINARTEIRPAELSRTGVRHFRKLLSDLNLVVCCVRFPTRRTYSVSEGLDERLEATKGAMTMAYDLGCGVVSNQIGLIPETDSLQRQTMIEALEELGRHGQRVGSVLAGRTGRQDGLELADFIKSLTPGALYVDFDPADLLINGHDIERSMRALGSFVVHFRARDAVQDLSLGRGLEVQLGRGSLDLPPLLAILEENAYGGFITVDRQADQDTITQYAQSLEYLDQLFS